MTEHVTNWLNAYLDGELYGLRLRQVEDHLQKCAACRAELGDLQRLSKLLQETVPAENFTPTDRFVANLTLSLPRRPVAPRSKKPAEIVWWLVPAGILGAMVFTQTVLSVSMLVASAKAAGLFGNMAAWLQGGPQHSEWFSAAMSLFGGSLSEGIRAFLGTLDGLNVFRMNFFAPLLWQAGIGMLYWIWLIVWWNRRLRPSGFPK